MKIGSENFVKALQIISKSNDVKLSINVPITDNYSSVYAILIHNSNASLINDLVSNGYSLYMTNKGLSIDKF